jgi:uncharacterized membrane protein
VACGPLAALSYPSLAVQGTLTQPEAKLLDNQPFMFAAFMSAALRLVSLLLYQSAIQLAPLSTTIPYLSFTPAMLIVTAYLMIGEQPSLPGLIGVSIVTLGGYLLARSTAHTSAKKSDDSVQEEASQLSSPQAAAASGEESLGNLEMGSSLMLLPASCGAGQGMTSALVRHLPTTKHMLVWARHPM